MTETSDTHTHNLQCRETILLVEDEDMIRELARNVLEMNGYIVLPASDAAEALAICREYEGTIHLMLTDVVMPKMSGRALSEQVKRFRPEIKILYMSGYTDDDVLRHLIFNSSVAFLQKPFSLDGLTRKVHALLSDRAR